MNLLPTLRNVYKNADVSTKLLTFRHFSTYFSRLVWPNLMINPILNIYSLSFWWCYWFKVLSKNYFHFSIPPSTCLDHFFLLALIFFAHGEKFDSTLHLKANRIIFPTVYRNLLYNNFSRYTLFLTKFYWTNCVKQYRHILFEP